MSTLTTEQAIIRDLNRAWTDLICLQIKFEDNGFYSYEDRFNSVGYMETARRSIARYREELDTHRAQAATFEARVNRLTDAAVTVGDPAAVAVAYLTYGPTVLTLADVVTPPAPAPVAVPRLEPLTAATLPKSQALANQAATAAEEAFWDHAEDCIPCFNGATQPLVQGLCPAGMGFQAARLETSSIASNWPEYDAWFNHGGYEHWAANDWIA